MDPECVEEEPDREEAQKPVAGLPHRDVLEVFGAVAEDREALADACLELVDVDPRPEEPDRPEDHQRDQQHGRELGVRDEEAEVEAGEAAERADAGKDAERKGVGEDHQRHRRVEDGEDEQRRPERDVGGGGHGAVREVEPDGVAGAGRDDRVDAHAGEV